ncbi:hypothetical protein NVP1148O_63 [Vibrio phage 1.148.O._10N.286.54.A10]|nr:hypothetical protein NVP1148O_63 [Vibrio phage 1.148.O._10N.286.54.A10]
MDYKELLKKFVQAACDAEGVTYDEYLQVKEYWLSQGVKTYL